MESLKNDDAVSIDCCSSLRNWSRDLALFKVDNKCAAIHVGRATTVHDLWF